MTMSFIVAATILVLAAIAVLLRPFIGRRRNIAGTTRQALNAAIYRDQLAELERDRAAGLIAMAESRQSTEELQRRLLQDASVAEIPASALRTPKPLILTLAVVIPVCAALLYAWLGNPGAQRQQAPAHSVTAAQIEDMVANLAARLEKNPGDMPGWVMLARSYKALGRFEPAEMAYARLGAALEQDPGLLAEYADVLAMLANGNLEGRPQAALDKSLKLDPDNALALELAGYSAFRRNLPAEAIRYWERLLKQLPPDSDHARSVSTAIDQARGRPDKAGANAASSGGAKSAVAAEPRPAAKQAAKPGNAKTALSGRVTLSPALAAKVQADDTLFILARAIDGPRVPLAVLRTRAGALPLDFTLDDSQSMSPEFSLSAVAPGSEVRVEARISKSGEAIAQPGDLIGKSGSLKPGTGGIRIMIERTAP
jgi:cytochrome c-type biogenesis protein CcmH